MDYIQRKITEHLKVESWDEIVEILHEFTEDKELKKIESFIGEVILRFMKEEQWESLIILLGDSNFFDFIQNDTLRYSIFRENFINELIKGEKFETDLLYDFYLKELIKLHNKSNHSLILEENEVDKLIEKIAKTLFKKYKNDKSYENKDYLREAYDYALKIPGNSHAKKIIKEYEEQQPVIIEHSQMGNVTVTTNKNIKKNDARRSLFRGSENSEYQSHEQVFYYAIREVFPTFLIYPNIALNTVIDFNKIKNKLTKEEKDYFFRALIDCVVIDQENDYKPLLFIELDSKAHDGSKEMKNDQMKNKILSEAGQTLYRIRSFSNKNEVLNQYQIIIKEVISQIREN